MSIRAKGNGWEVRVYPLGGRMAESITEARRLEREMMAERDASDGLGRCKLKLGVYAERWLREVVAVKRSAGTYKAWAPGIRLRLLPSALAAVRLCDIRPRDVDGYVTSLGRYVNPKTGKRLTGRTQHKDFEALHALFEHAVKMEDLRKNPAANVDRPRQERSAKRIWSAEQTRQFVAACLADGHRCCLILALKPYVGCRVEEICQAEEPDYDREHRVLIVWDGKTDASRRPVALTSEAMFIIDRALTEQGSEEERAHWDAQALQERWLFRGPSGHCWYERKVLYHFHRIRQQLGLPHSVPHDLRHYFGTAAKRAGFATKDISMALGHSTTAITEMVYQHVDVPELHAVAEGVAATLRVDDTVPCPHCGGTGRIRPPTAS